MPIGAGFDSPTSTRPAPDPRRTGGAQGGGGVEGTVHGIYLDMLGRAVTTEAMQRAQDFLTAFNNWTLTNGMPMDPDDPEISRQFLQMLEAEQAGAAGGGGGRTQFASEAALDMATVGLRQEQAKSEAFMRAKSKYDLLQVTDQLADSRREAATEALTSLLPFMVNPDQEFTPGFEPGGVGPQLGSLLGANVPAQQMPTMEVPLNELANPPLAAPAQEISGGLQSLL